MPLRETVGHGLVQAGVTGLWAGLQFADNWRCCMGQLCKPSHCHPRFQPPHTGAQFHQQHVDISITISVYSIYGLNEFKINFHIKQALIKGVPHWLVSVLKRQQLTLGCWSLKLSSVKLWNIFLHRMRTVYFVLHHLLWRWTTIHNTEIPESPECSTCTRHRSVWLGAGENILGNFRCYIWGT